MQNREFIVFERIRDTEHWESTSRACICDSRAHYPPRIPSSTNRRVDSCTTYEYNCRICPLEVFVFRLKDNKKFQRTGKIFACWYSSNDSFNQKHITLKGITLFQCWGFLENQSKFTSWYGITDTQDCPAIVMKTLYHDVNEALQRAITVLLSEIRPKSKFKMARIDLFGTK